MSLALSLNQAFDPWLLHAKSIIQSKWKGSHTLCTLFLPNRGQKRIWDSIVSEKMGTFTMSFLRLKRHTGNNCNWKTVRQDFSGAYAYVWEKLYKKTIRICNEFGQNIAITLFMSRVSSHLIKPDLDSACQLSSLTSRNPASRHIRPWSVQNANM